MTIVHSSLVKFAHARRHQMLKYIIASGIVSSFKTKGKKHIVIFPVLHPKSTEDEFSTMEVSTAGSESLAEQIEQLVNTNVTTRHLEHMRPQYYFRNKAQQLLS